MVTNGCLLVLTQLAGSGADKLLKASPPCIDKAANDGAFDDLIEREQQLDNVLVAELRSSIEQSKSTQSALVKQCSLNNGALERFLNKDTRWRHKQSCHSLQIDTLMGMIVQQDNKIIKVHNTYVKQVVNMNTIIKDHTNPVTKIQRLRYFKQIQ